MHWLIVLLFMVWFTPASASHEVVYQCVLPDGRTIFQGHPCPRQFTDAEIRAAEAATRRQSASPPLVATPPTSPAAAPAPPQQKLQQSAGNDCPCGTGRICTGKRGGQFCWSNTGKKRYLAREQKLKPQ